VRLVPFGLFSLFTLLFITTTLYAALDLEYFTANEWKTGDTAITLRWKTGTELGHSAFHVWRSIENLPIENFQIDTSNADRLTNQFLLNPDNNPCTQQGYEYEYADETINNQEDAYYYYLETFNCSDGGSEFQGYLDRIGGVEVRNPAFPTPTPTATATATNTPVAITQLFLPLVMAGQAAPVSRPTNHAALSQVAAQNDSTFFAFEISTKSEAQRITRKATPALPLGERHLNRFAIKQ